MRTITDKHVRFTFENMIDIPAYLKTTTSEAHAQGMNASLSNEDSFNGGVSYDGAIRLVTSGWLEGAEKVSKLRKKHDERFGNAYANLPQQRFTPDVGGGFCVTAEAVIGYPTPFRRPKFVKRPTKVLDLYWLSAASAHVKSEQFVKQGVALMACIDQMEASGIRVALTVFGGSVKTCRMDLIGSEEDDSPYTCAWTVKVKRFQERLQLSELAFPMAHAAFFRRLGFGLIERQGSATRSLRFKTGYGDRPIRRKDIGRIPGLIPKDTVVVVPDYDEDTTTAYLRMLKQLTSNVADKAVA